MEKSGEKNGSVIRDRAYNKIVARAFGILAVFILAALGTAGAQSVQSTQPRKKTTNNGVPPEKIPGDPKPPERPPDADKETEKERLKAQPPSPDDPPEEDEALKPKIYDFNPLAAEKAIKAGEFYYKKSNYVAASARFLEATRFNPTNAEAFLRLGEAHEKNHKPADAIEAYRKYVELAPDTKQAAALKKKLDSKPAKKN